MVPWPDSKSPQALVHRQSAEMMRHARFRRLRPLGRERVDEASVATVEAVVCNMEPVRREVLLLHRVDRLGYAAIGERLSLSRVEVKAHISEAATELAGALAVPGVRPERQPGECPASG
ncbi:hypothetical protein FLX56_26195 [Synechococcus moorigangaii CMS01]|nr:hypothetical protein [Synechococcus moorigangaii CMS01]